MSPPSPLEYGQKALVRVHQTGMVGVHQLPVFVKSNTGSLGQCVFLSLAKKTGSTLVSLAGCLLVTAVLLRALLSIAATCGRLEVTFATREAFAGGFRFAALASSA